MLFDERHKMDRQTVIGLLIFAALFLIALSFRYKMAGGAEAVHIIDGWTGRTWYCAGWKCMPTRAVDAPN